MHDIVVIGAGPAGMTAAIYARRAAKTVLVLEALTPGGQIINTPDIENYPAEAHISGFDFSDRLHRQALGLGAVFALVTAVSAVFLGIRKILDITPSMAMRAHSPENVRQLKVFRNGSFLVRMAMRSLLRNPFRSFLIALSAAFPFAMSSVLLSYGGVVQDMIMTEFGEVEQFDYMLTLDAEHSPCAAEESACIWAAFSDSDSPMVAYTCRMASS